MNANSIRSAFLPFLASAFLLVQPTAQAVPALGLTTDNSLIQFDTLTPATLTSGPTAITGLQTGETLLGLDRRPANGLIYALGSTGRIYTINLITAAATQVAVLAADPADATNPFASLSGSEFGIDFNPVPDRMRVVSDNDQNLRINVDTGLVTTDAPLAFAVGDANAGDDPTVTGSAYTNSFAGATATTLYGIDFTNRVLVTQNPPNNGTLNTVGSVLVSDNISLSGFDIAAGTNQGFATFTSGFLPTTSYLYEIDLGTGASSAIDQIGPNGTGRVRGLALLPAGTIRFSAATYSINEGDGSIKIPVFRTGDTTGMTTVTYTTADGTATNVFDYQGGTGTVTFAAGESIRTIEIPIVNSPVAEPDETFTITLSNIGGSSAVLENPSSATVTIVDDSSAAAHPPAVTIYAVTTNNFLFSFQSDDPSTPSNIVTITGLQSGERIVGIDFRPAGGALYGLGSGSRLYVINRQTGVAHQVGSDGAFTLSGTEFGFDFNPVPDRIRVTSNTGQNLRLNPNDGTLAGTDTPLAYDLDTDGAGADTQDPLAGQTPTVTGSGYSNPDTDPLTGTTLYDIDSASGTLAIQNPPNNGTLSTIGPLGVSTSNLVGFDIAYTSAAFASISNLGVNNLFTVNLTTGQTMDLGAVAFPDAVRGIAVLPPPATFNTAKLVNLSARALVQTDDNVAIGGFIIRGEETKRIIVRGLGTSLQVNGTPVAGRLADPILTLHESNGAVIEVNDDWQTSSHAASIQSAGLAPSSPKESAIEAMLVPGGYTAILRGVNMGTGIGLVEIYDVNGGGPADTNVDNISARAFISTGDNVLINGIILSGANPQSILFRAIGPDLETERGVVGSLQDPTMGLYNASGTLLSSNDNWRDSQQASIQATGLAPHDDHDPAILMTLGPGNYTTVIQGKGGATGIALGEAYNVGQ